MSLTRPEAVVVALLQAGGSQQHVHTEDVALAAGKLAPRLFSWTKFHDLVDKELVRVALSDARLKKHWTIGSHAQGWMLTAAGLEFARQNVERVGDEAREGLQARDPRLERERARLLQSEAFRRATHEGVEAVSDEEADAFFRLIAYIRDQARERKIAYIENVFGEDPELGTVVKQLAQRARGRT